MLIKKGECQTKIILDNDNSYYYVEKRPYCLLAR